MAYTSANLRLVKGGVINEWVYDTADSFDTVIGASYVTDAVAISNGVTGKGMKEGDRVMVRRYGTVGTTSTFIGSFDCVVRAINTTTGASTLAAFSNAQEPYTASVALAASVTTDGMAITITMLDADGNTLAAVYGFDWWIAESATVATVTADSYSGTVTAGTGYIITDYTAKKHFAAVTAATGIFVATAVDSANPTDQYIWVKLPNGKIVVSAASGTNWEGA